MLVSADASFRQKLAEILIGMRWKVREAAGGAQALSYLEEATSEALLLDFWLPDLEAGDFAEQLRIQYPNLDLICVNEAEEMVGKPRSARRPELLHALRRAQETGSSVCAGHSEIRPEHLSSPWRPAAFVLRKPMGSTRREAFSTPSRCEFSPLPRKIPSHASSADGRSGHGPSVRRSSFATSS